MYYSHFTGLYFSSCLIFQTIQNLLLVSGRTRTFRALWYLCCSYIYWTTLAVSGFMCAVAYSMTPKPDVVAIQSLIFLNGLTGVSSLIALHRIHARRGLNQGNMELSSENITTGPAVTNNKLPGHTGKIPTSSHQGSRGVRNFYCICKIFNRFLKVVHWVMSILFIAGAIQLGLTYSFTNPYVTCALDISKH